MEKDSPAPSTSTIPSAPRYRRILGHPGFRLFESILAVLGVVLAIFFYYQSRFRREPYFYVDPTRNILVNRELAIGDKLSVTFAGRPTQHGDIAAMQCYFWNAGRAPVHEHEILRPIKLILDAGNEILDVSVIRQSRPDIVQFRANTDTKPDGTPTNIASISFKILEQDDGASLQILYAGGPKTSVSFGGVVEGGMIKKLPRPLDAFREDASRESEFERSTKRGFVLMALFPMMFPLMPFFGDLKRLGVLGSAHQVTTLFSEFTSFWVMFSLWLLCLAAAYYYLFYFYPAIPANLLT